LVGGFVQGHTVPVVSSLDLLAILHSLHFDLFVGNVAELIFLTTGMTSELSQKSTATKFGNLPRHSAQSEIRFHM